MNEMISAPTGANSAPDQELALIQTTAERFALSAKIAESMCRASILPVHLRTKKEGQRIVDLSPEEVQANCMLIVNQALRWGVDPFALLPSTFVIGGNLGFEGKLFAAIVNKLGRLKSPLNYRFTGKGDDLTVTVFATLQNETEPREVSVRLGDAKTDNQIWRKDPQQKLKYTGATRWARTHCPEVIFGIVSDDEPPAMMVEATATVRDAQPAPAAESKPLDLVDLIKSYKQRLDDATTIQDVEAVGKRIKVDAALTEPARRDLRELALERYNELSADDE